MKKTQTVTENGVTHTKYSSERRDYIKVGIATLIIIPVLLFGLHTALSALMPKQMIYDSAVIDYNKQGEQMFLARKNLLKAEKQWGKEKLEIAFEAEEWEEVERLTLRIKELTSTLNSQSEWKVFPKE